MSSESRVIKRWRRDPAKFCEECFGDFLWSKQRELLNALRDGHTHIVVKAAHAVSKSFTSGRIAAWNTSLFRPSLTFTTAPTYHQVNNIVWKEIRDCYESSKVLLAPNAPLKGEPRWDIKNNQRAFGRSSDKPGNIQGIHEADRVVVIADEFAGIEGVIIPAIKAISTGDGNITILIGNPDVRHVEFMAAFNDPKYYKMTISAFDSPNFTGEKVPAHVSKALVGQAFVDDLAETYGEDSAIYKSKVLAEFPDQDAQTLIPLSYVEYAKQREININFEHRRDAGCDVARYGTDRTVVYRIDGNHAYCVHEAGKQSTMETAGHCAAQFMDGYRVSIDDTGVGGGVTDRLIELEHSPHPVNFAQKAIEETRFLNARSEMYWNLRSWLKNVGHIEPDSDLQKELTSIQYKMHSSGRIQVESKEDIRKRLGKSPDKADALALAVGGFIYGGVIAQLTDDDWSAGGSVLEDF